MDSKPYDLSASQIDMVAGTFAGMISTFISHPLDTVKVRIQLDKGVEKLTVRRCMFEVYTKEGVSASTTQFCFQVRWLL